MDLMCTESPHFGQTIRAPMDSTIVGDTVVFQRLLENQARYTISCEYCKCVQNEVTEPMRKILAVWMSEVCEEQGCEDVVLPCAMNYLDRYLARVCVRKSQLQLLGAVCLLMASKMRQCRSIAVESLVYYTDFSVTAEEIKDWELLVLGKLDWDVASILANDFVDHLLIWLGVTKDRDTVRRHANTFISLCATEYKFVRYAPSLLAAASVAAAIHGLGCSPGTVDCEAALIHSLHNMTDIEEGLIRQAVQDIEFLMASSVASLQQQQQSYNKTNTAYSSGKLSSSMTTSRSGSQPNTPTDIQDINF